MSSVPTLGYWNIRGLVQPIRLLLKYTGAKFNDKTYEFGQFESMADIESLRKYWNKDKYSLGLDFPNLPYYIDDNIKLTQSLAILRYLGRKHGLVAGDDLSIARLEMMEQQIEDMRMKFFLHIIETGFEAKNAEYIRGTLEPQLELLVKYLGDNEWLAGSITYLDFLLYETLDWFKLFTPETIDKFSTLKEYLNRFESLPAIKAYQSSSQHKSWPLFGPIVKWGFIK